jgi:DNA-directed RNA polymerase specialized sigma24 family protein
MINVMENLTINQHYRPNSGQVHQAVAALPPIEREALMLVCVKGLNYQDAAQRLGISPGVFQEHLLRSRLTLIAKLKLKG